jgi:hypothetical protein
LNQNSLCFDYLPTRIIEVIWTPPLAGWIKCNADGTSLGSTGQTYIFRDNNDANLGCFALNLGIANALFAEVMGIILAIGCAFDRGWSHLW